MFTFALDFRPVHFLIFLIILQFVQAEIAMDPKGKVKS